MGAPQQPRRFGDAARAPRAREVRRRCDARRDDHARGPHRSGARLARRVPAGRRREAGGRDPAERRRDARVLPGHLPAPRRVRAPDRHVRPPGGLPHGRHLHAAAAARLDRRVVLPRAPVRERRRRAVLRDADGERSRGAARPHAPRRRLARGPRGLPRPRLVLPVRAGARVRDPGGPLAPAGRRRGLGVDVGGRDVLRGLGPLQRAARRRTARRLSGGRLHPRGAPLPAPEPASARRARRRGHGPALRLHDVRRGRDVSRPQRPFRAGRRRRIRK